MLSRLIVAFTFIIVGIVVFDHVQGQRDPPSHTTPTMRHKFLHQTSTTITNQKRHHPTTSAWHKYMTKHSVHTTPTMRHKHHFTTTSTETHTNKTGQDKCPYANKSENLISSILDLIPHIKAELAEKDLVSLVFDWIPRIKAELAEKEYFQTLIHLMKEIVERKIQPKHSPSANATVKRKHP
ncbi:unnamed protein product [Schistosoma turkestanicum]|nr:unnamed protein product [Schistosoma turkestanicum]